MSTRSVLTPKQRELNSTRVGQASAKKADILNHVNRVRRQNYGELKNTLKRLYLLNHLRYRLSGGLKMFRMIIFRGVIVERKPVTPIFYEIMAKKCQKTLNFLA